MTGPGLCVTFPEERRPASQVSLVDVRALLLDLDGTLIRGGKAIEGAVDFVARHAGRVAIVSNNSSDTAETLSEKLCELGFNLRPSRIFLAGVMALEYLAEAFAGQRVMILGSPAIVAQAQTLGLVLTDAAPDAVLIARDESFSYVKLAAAANAIASGAKFYVSNADVYHPGTGTWRVPEAGSLMLAVMAIAGRSPDKVFGKPDGHMLKQALRRLHVPGSNAVMIGDNPATDGLAAQHAEIRFIEVGDRVGRTVADLAFTGSGLFQRAVGALCREDIVG
ncbi:MAG: HAD-IIA family hydrolase [Bosea sp. (in: a-proteobacteria)]